MTKTYLTRAPKLLLILISIFVLISGCAPQPVWSYVALGDQTPLGLGVGDDNNYVEYFADYLREDLGVELEVHNYGTYSLYTGRLLDLLQTDPEIRQAVADANVITVWIGEDDIYTLQIRYVYGTCGGEDNLDCIREKVPQINENIDGILDELLALNTSEETRIMIADNVISSWFFKEWEEHGCFDVIQRELWETVQDHLVKAANERGIIVVYTNRVINGPLGDQDNEELYRLNGHHWTEEGHKLLADLHREAWE